MPLFVPVRPDANLTKVYDKETGITQRRLSNGIPVNYMVQLPFLWLMGSKIAIEYEIC